MENSQSPMIFDPNNGSLVIRVEREGFANFVKGLLGRPQTINNYYPSNFCIGKEHVEHLFHIVHQRVTQQNKAELIQFSITIVYENDSTVLLNSLEDFLSYREIGSRKSVAAKLDWSYLIQFEDKNFPEKQTIEVAIDTQSGEKYSLRAGKRVPSIIDPGFNVIINHTARTWGNDIENLLSQQIQAWTTKSSPIKKFIRNNAGWVSIFIGLLCFTSFMIGMYIATHDALEAIQAEIMRASLFSMEEKLNMIVKYIIDPKKDSIRGYAVISSLSALILSTALGIATMFLASRQDKSFLLLSEAATIAQKEDVDEDIKGWRYFVASCATSILSGVASRYLFKIFFEN